MGSVTPIRFHAVAPIGERTIPASVIICQRGAAGPPRDVRERVYPPSPAGDRLREQRIALALGLREAARELGLSARELSDLEWGRAAFADDGEADRALELLAEAARNRDQGP